MNMESLKREAFKKYGDKIGKSFKLKYLDKAGTLISLSQQEDIDIFLKRASNQERLLRVIVFKTED